MSMEGWKCACVVAVLYVFIALAVSRADDVESEDDGVLYCWECMNYDTKGNFYDQCPVNGTVDPVRAYKGNCTGKCFTHTDDRNKALIIRGCTATQWGLPDPLPDDGCYPWYSEVWCVCSTDDCNGEPLGKPTTVKEFDSHIDYNKPKDDGSDGGPLGQRFWISTILLSAAVAVTVPVCGFTGP